MISTYKKNNNLINSLFLEKNHFDISSLHQLNAKFESNGIAIKCVLDGVEHYTITGDQVSIKAGRYLMTNMSSDCIIDIDSPKVVKGICVNLTEDLVTNVVSSIIMPNTADSDLNLGHYFSSNLFLNGEYDTNSNYLGKYLLENQHIFQNIDIIDENFCTELFYSIAEKLIIDQIPVYKSLQAIQSIKLNTKKDLMHRILRGKNYMDEHFLDTIYIKDIAMESCMSEYHFYRLFKEAFRETPYKYILRKKLEFSFEKLKLERISISELSIITGFTDICSFSKSFKKHFGFNPSEFKLNTKPNISS
jgi:AraC family transcriptional regulator